MSEASSGTIVVGVDGTDRSLHALRQALLITSGFCTKVVAVFVHQLPPLVGDEPPVAVEAYEESLAEAQRETEVGVKAILDPTNQPWKLEVRRGDAAQQLVETAHEESAALIAIGATMHGSVASMVISPVAAYLLHHSDVALLLIRPEAE